MPEPPPDKERKAFDWPAGTFTLGYWKLIGFMGWHAIRETGFWSTFWFVIRRRFFWFDIVLPLAVLPLLAIQFGAVVLVLVVMGLPRQPWMMRRARCVRRLYYVHRIERMGRD